MPEAGTGQLCLERMGDSRCEHGQSPHSGYVRRCTATPANPQYLHVGPASLHPRPSRCLQRMNRRQHGIGLLNQPIENQRRPQITFKRVFKSGELAVWGCLSQVGEQPWRPTLSKSRRRPTSLLSVTTMRRVGHQARTSMRCPLQRRGEHHTISNAMLFRWPA